MKPAKTRRPSSAWRYVAPLAEGHSPIVSPQTALFDADPRLIQPASDFSGLLLEFQASLEGNCSLSSRLCLQREIERYVILHTEPREGGGNDYRSKVNKWARR